MMCSGSVYFQFVQIPHKETPFLSCTIRVQSGRNRKTSSQDAMQAMKTAHLRQKPGGAAPLKKHLGVLIHRQRRFLLLSTALAVFVWLRIKPLSLASLASIRIKPLSLASLASSPSRGALGIPLCLHRYSVTVLVHAPLTVANRLHESPSFPSDTRPERGSGLFLRQKP